MIKNNLQITGFTIIELVVYMSIASFMYVIIVSTFGTYLQINNGLQLDIYHHHELFIQTIK
jgi:type II secretory pathway pseudopilin PulG